MKKTLVNCGECGVSFLKENKYIKQSIKRGLSGHFCSRSCVGKRNLRIGKDKIDQWLHGAENDNILRNNNSNRADEYSPFRTHLASAKKRGKECDLDLRYLKELFESQNGKCAVTGVELSLKRAGNPNFQASIDRINSSIGYTRGNVRFTSVSINWVKSNLNDDHLKEFIEICKESASDGNCG